MKALLIIDMQRGSFIESTPRYDTDGVVKRINELAAYYRELNLPVIFVQHDGSRDGNFIPGSAEWALLPGLETHPQDRFVQKYANDVFYHSPLQAYLLEKGIDEIVVTGCATDFCVDATIQSALSKDHVVTVVKDAHTTADRPHLTAKQIIEHYNWVWQNMIPTRGNVRVLATSEILAEE